MSTPAALPPPARPPTATSPDWRNVIRARRADGALTDFTRYVTAHGHQLTRPVLAIAELIQEALTSEVEAVVTMPPRHGKTSTLLLGLTWLLTRRPDRTNAYVTYGQRLANSKSRHARNIIFGTGTKLDPAAGNLMEWRTVAGGGLLATGVGGPLTGFGITGLGIVDDPLKGRKEADSAVWKEMVWDWWTDVYLTRREPGSSTIVTMTRWAKDDLAGRLIDDGWRHINLPALDDTGEALWPERYPVRRLEHIRKHVGEYTWASLYQGRPVPRDQTVFADPTYYSTLPDSPYREGHAIDVAYVARTRADYSAIVTGRVIGETLYITNVTRRQVTPGDFTRLLESRGITRVAWALSGTELGMVGLLEERGITVSRHPALADKHARAQPAAAAWNAGRIAVPIITPDNKPWLEPFLAEVLGFTGVDDLHDDMVDALATLYDDLLGRRFELADPVGWEE